MKKSFAALLLTASALSLGFSTPAAADVKDGVDAWGKGDFARAISEWRGPANNGDADAQFNLGQAYKLGRGVPMDLRQAETWYKMAANQGHVQASDNLGLILFQDNRRKEALPLLLSSSRRGEPRAQYVLGTGYFNGDFVEKDWVRAYALTTRASASGLRQASQNLAEMDKFISLEDRRKGIALAAQLEQDERRVRANQTAGLRLPPPSSVQTAQLPPSTAAAPARPPVPVVSAPPAPARFPSTPPVAAPQRPLAPPPVTIAPAPVRAAAPVSAGNGNWRIQLGAFGQVDRAKQLWNSLERRVSSLSGLQPYLVNAGSVTRLQAGNFDTRGQADRACASVKAAGNGCIVKAR